MARMKDLWMAANEHLYNELEREPTEEEVHARFLELLNCIEQEEVCQS